MSALLYRKNFAPCYVVSLSHLLVFGLPGLAMPTKSFFTVNL